MIHSIRRDFSPQLDGVILIDCWDYSMHPMHELKDQQLKVFYRSLVNRLKQFKIQYVINAMTHGNVNQIDGYLEKELLSQVPNCTIDTRDQFDTCVTQTLRRSVTQWYIAGQTWGVCVHNNDIGLKRIAREPYAGFDFYTDQVSFRNKSNGLVEHQDFIEDELGWEYLPWFGYRLIQN